MMLMSTAEIDREQRQDRAELNQHLEGAAGAFEAQEMADQEKVAVDETGMNSVSPSIRPSTSASKRLAGYP